MAKPRTLEIDYTRGEEVAGSALKPGEWYLVESEGFGLAPVEAFHPLGGDATSLRGLKFNPLTTPHTYVLRPQTFAEYVRDSKARPFYYPTGVNYRAQYFRMAKPPTFDPVEWRWELLRGWGSPKSGCDPEIFVEDSSGEVIPAYEFLPAKSEINPAAVSEPFWDGFQAEFATPAGICMDVLGQNIRIGLRKLHARMPKGSRFSPRSVVEINPKVLRAAKQQHVDFGCRPSLNAYGLVGEVVSDPRSFPLRFAGGHFHWGTKESIGGENHDALANDSVKFLDATLGLASVSLFEKLDDPRRRRYYGLAGEYRLPKHGLEYRVLSNAWLIDPAIYHLLFTLGRTVLRLGFLGMRERILPIPERVVIQAITSGDAALARQLMHESKDFWAELIQNIWGPDAIKFTWDTLLNPVENLGLDMRDSYQNWLTKGCDGIMPPSFSGYPLRWGYYAQEPSKWQKGVESVRAEATPLATDVSSLSGNTISL